MDDYKLVQTRWEGIERQWVAALSGRKPLSTTETPFVVSRLAEERG